MMLADCIAQCRQPYIVRTDGGRVFNLSGAAEFRDAMQKCPLRYVLGDDLTRLCADLAYSRRARQTIYGDLLHVPAETLWLEWSNKPWQEALRTYGFPLVDGGCQWLGRRGVFIRAARDGRSGWFRTFWDDSDNNDVLASAMEGYFDFDTPEDQPPTAPDKRNTQVGQVFDGAAREEDVLARCFRFRYEESWDLYYQCAHMTSKDWHSVWRHNLGAVAMDVPMMLVFFLLLATRAGLPQERSSMERVNRRRLSSGRPLLLEHVRVRAPILWEPNYSATAEVASPRKHRRLHHVRGHLVRRGNQVFWRVPHLRGYARLGAIRTRTVVWSFDKDKRLDTRRRSGLDAQKRAEGASNTL